MATSTNSRDYVILYFPASLRRNKFVGFPTRNMISEEPLEPEKLMKIYLADAGWVACFVVKFFGSYEEMLENFVREIKNFRRHYEVVSNGSRFYALYFPRGIRGKTLQHFNTKRALAGTEIFAKWLDVFVSSYNGWRKCFVFAIFNSQEEIRKNFINLLGTYIRFTKNVEVLTAYQQLLEEEEKNKKSTTVMSTEAAQEPFNADFKISTFRQIEAEREHLPSFNFSSIPLSEEEVTDQAQNVQTIDDDDDVIYVSPEEEKILKRHSDRYSLAIRQLLKLHFPPDVLMTHSLTGQASPPLANKQYKAKPVLNEAVVSHITEVVMKNFNGVSRTTIRRIMTNTLADAKKIKTTPKEISSSAGEE